MPTHLAVMLRSRGASTRSGDGVARSIFDGATEHVIAVVREAYLEDAARWPQPAGYGFEVTTRRRRHHERAALGSSG